MKKKVSQRKTAGKWQATGVRSEGSEAGREKVQRGGKIRGKGPHKLRGSRGRQILSAGEGGEGRDRKRC